MRTLVDRRRLAGRTARIGTVCSKAVRRRMTVPSLNSAAKSHAGAWAIPRCLRTPIRIHHFLRQLKRNTVFLDYVSHWTFTELPEYYLTRTERALLTKYSTWHPQ